MTDIIINTVSVRFINTVSVRCAIDVARLNTYPSPLQKDVYRSQSATCAILSGFSYS